MKKIDTFSANSLKLLDKSVLEFENKYLYNLSIMKKDKRAILGQKFHNLICFYIKNFDVSKLTLNLTQDEQKSWYKLEDYLKDKKDNFIKTEYSFLIKEKLNSKPYFLTGRFDAVYKKDDFYIIYDWKTLNIPKNPKDDLQSIVYLFCANKIFKTDKIKLKYLSIEKLDSFEIPFINPDYYKEKLDKIILKHFIK